MKIDKIDDEVLCAYIDGELDESARRKVERVIAEDEELEQRLFDLERGDFMLRRAFPSPAKVTPKPASSPRSSMFHWLQAGALVAASLAGVVVGVNLQRTEMPTNLGSLVMYEHLETSPVFQETMERRPSGTVVEWKQTPEQTSILEPIQTFKIADGTYCREFELDEAKGKISGLVCRDQNGYWGVNSLKYVRSTENNGLAL